MNDNGANIQVWIRPFSGNGQEKWDQWPPQTSSTKLTKLAEDIRTVLYNESNIEYTWDTHDPTLPSCGDAAIAKYRGKLIKLAFQKLEEYWIYLV